MPEDMGTLNTLLGAVGNDCRGLRVSLADWHDWDGAMFELAVCLGLMPAATAEPMPAHLKRMFLGGHPIGNRLIAMLEDLVQLKVLQRRDAPDHQYRWNPAFKGSWE